LLAREIRRRIEHIAPLTPVPRRSNDGPSRGYRFDGASGEIGFIAAVSRHFCEHCNRLRLTADGGLRPCLLSDRTINIKTALRSGAPDETLAGILISAVDSKPQRHTLREKQEACLNPMGSIGG